MTTPEIVHDENTQNSKQQFDHLLRQEFEEALKFIKVKEEDLDPFIAYKIISDIKDKLLQKQESSRLKEIERLQAERDQLAKNNAINKQAEEIEETTIELQCFVNSQYSWQDVLNDVRKNQVMYKQSYLNILASCIAMTSKSTYIVKEKNYHSQKIEYNLKSSAELKELTLNIDIFYKTTEEDRLKQKKSKTKQTEFMQESLHKLIRTQEFREICKYYPDFGIIGNDKNVFALRRPPLRHLYLNKRITYKPEMIKQFFTFAASLYRNPNAFIDLINTIKYQMSNPGKKAIRFFIQFELKGKSGKTFITDALAQIFGSLAMTNVKPCRMKDPFNAWIEKLLFLCYEEGQSDNYTDNDVEIYIKNSTNPNKSIRAMRKETRQGSSYEVQVLNTNDPGLYGIARSDDAPKLRVVLGLLSHLIQIDMMNGK